MKDYSVSPFAAEAKEACPWRDTDHRQPGAYNGDTYCTWCEGYVAGAEAQSERAHRSWLAKQGRRLASQREDLIAQGVDPADLEVPLHPEDEQ